MATKKDSPCLQNAADDEPIFVLRAQDKWAPTLVRLWADLAVSTGCPEAKVEGARKLAAEMRKWGDKTGRAKWPD